MFGVELRRSGSGYDLEAILSDCRIGLRAGGVGGRINQSRVFHTWEGARNVTLEAGGDSGSKLSEGISCSHALSLGCNFANFVGISLSDMYCLHIRVRQSRSLDLGSSLLLSKLDLLHYCIWFFPSCYRPICRLVM